MSPVIFDGYEKESLTDEMRRRASLKVVRAYGSTSADPIEDRLVRPIDHLCRHCCQRRPLGHGKFCAECVQVRSRYNPRRSRFHPAYFILIGFIVFLVVWSLCEWARAAEPRTNFQTPTNKGTRKSTR